MTLSTTISKWGNGQGIRVPKTLMELLEWKNNDKLEIVVEEGNIRIRKVENKRKRKSIEELFENYKGEYKNQEIDWGEPKGEEVW